jgi:hypothetical protein
VDDEGGGLSTTPVPLRFRLVDIVAEGGATPASTASSRVSGWSLSASTSALASGDRPEARIRVIEWERILALQGIQRQDVLRQFMDRQRQMAADAPPL